jgi:RsiW-degrading membrane proteinase PrsW (M82 family)
MTSFFNSAFYFAGTHWDAILLSIALGLVFGAVWLFFYFPPIFKKQWFWVVIAVSAILSWSAIAFVQIPFQNWYVDAITHFWGSKDLSSWYLLIAFPLVLISGIVQEATKLAPVLLSWWRSKKSFTPRFGLMLGAVSGAGFGVFEAIWVHNQIFAQGISWSVVDNYALALWERVFAVAFYIATSALTGYGIAKKKGWLFYVIAAFLHGIVNFSAILIEDNKLTSLQSEFYLTFIAVAVTGWALWLRWRPEKEIPAEISPAGTPGDTSEIDPVVVPAADEIPPVVTPDVTPLVVTPDVIPPPVS